MMRTICGYLVLAGLLLAWHTTGRTETKTVPSSTKPAAETPGPTKTAPRWAYRGRKSSPRDPRWPYDKHFSTKIRPYTPKQYPDEGLVDVVSHTGRQTRGVYLTAYYLARVGAERIAPVLKAAHLNAVVIDVKDEYGSVLYPSKVPLSKGCQQRLIRDPKATFKTFREHGIYVIGRITSFKDSKLPLRRPDLAVRMGRDGKRLFRAATGWIDAYSLEVQDYLIDIARELQDAGIDEIQFDYIRFPKGRSGGGGKWLHRDGRTRAKLMADFLDRADRALRIPISVDVFGLTTWVDGDPRGLGQSLEALARNAEVISPMMYANGMTTYFKDNLITKHVYAMIHCGLWRTRNKLPNTILRPFLQAYPNSVSFFGKSFIIDQIDAVHRAGANGFLLWNPTMLNNTAYGAMRKIGESKLGQIGAAPEWYQKKENHPGAWCRRKGAVYPTRTDRKRERHQSQAKTL
jgi:hypothetical protein